jgi:hypothetical protein
MFIFGLWTNILYDESLWKEIYVRFQINVKFCRFRDETHG